MNKLIYYLMSFVVCLAGCSNTSAKHKYKNEVTHQQYLSDKGKLEQYIREMIILRKGPFYPKSYDEETKVIIDTIVYGPISSNKAIGLVLLKNSTSKLLHNPSSDLFYYDGRAFLLDTQDDDWTVEWFNILNINRFSKIEKASKILRQKYFNELSTLNTFTFNIDDKRFWEDFQWEKHLNNSSEKYESEF